MTPYLLKEAFLAKTHNLKHLTRHTDAVGIYHCSLLCSHSQISVRTEGRTDSTVTLRRMRRGLHHTMNSLADQNRIHYTMNYI